MTKFKVGEYWTRASKKAVFKILQPPSNWTVLVREVSMEGIELNKEHNLYLFTLDLVQQVTPVPTIKWKKVK